MNNPYVEYYTNQAGSGLSAYEGYRYQRGHGFFSTIFRSIIKPLGKYLGKQALSTGVNVGSDILSGDYNFKEALKKNGKITSENILGDAVNKARKYTQKGSGRRRRRKNKSSDIKPKKVKRKGKKKTKAVKRKKSTKTRHTNLSKFSHLF